MEMNTVIKMNKQKEPSSRLKASVLIYKRRLTRGVNINDPIHEQLIIQIKQTKNFSKL